MSNILTPPEDFNELVIDYRNQLDYFAYSNDLPPTLLAVPDHMMVKAADATDFAEKVREIKPMSIWNEQHYEKLAFMQLDWRFLAIARLAVPLTLAPSRYVDMLEIMEPKEISGHDYIGVEYASFYTPDINRAQKTLETRGVKVKRFYNQNRNWRWLNAVINAAGQELRLSDKTLEAVVDEELQDETARLI